MLNRVIEKFRVHKSSEYNTYLLTGKWGCGKTHFLRQMEKEVIDGDFDFLYFDAIKYNNWDNLVEPLQWFVGEKLNFRDEVSVKELAFGQFSNIKRVNKVNIDFINKLTMAAKNKKIIIAIDELDRVSPLKALQVLECTQYLLNVENVIVIYSIYKDVLETIVTATYGITDPSYYVQKYFHDEIVIGEDPEEFVREFMLKEGILDGYDVKISSGFFTTYQSNLSKRVYDQKMRKYYDIKEHIKKRKIGEWPSINKLIWNSLFNFSSINHNFRDAIISASKDFELIANDIPNPINLMPPVSSLWPSKSMFITRKGSEINSYFFGSNADVLAAEEELLKFSIEKNKLLSSKNSKDSTLVTLTKIEKIENAEKQLKDYLMEYSTNRAGLVDPKNYISILEEKFNAFADKHNINHMKIKFDKKDFSSIENYRDFLDRLANDFTFEKIKEKNKTLFSCNEADDIKMVWSILDTIMGCNIIK